MLLCKYKKKNIQINIINITVYIALAFITTLLIAMCLLESFHKLFINMGIVLVFQKGHEGRLNYSIPYYVYSIN